MVARLAGVALEAHDPEHVARCWAALLGREVLSSPLGLSLPGDATQPTLVVVGGRDRGPHASRMHLHLTSTSLDDQQRLVDTALRHGATHLDVGQLPEEDHVVLADPAGNELCVLGPGNTFLEGCGLLGEVGCDGTRDVGVFWSAALAWPLVWDEDGETAIQSPQGGTKIAWGGPPVAPHHGPSRQRLELTAGEPGDPGGVEAEVARLCALGATRRGDLPEGGVELCDPGQDPFVVRPPGAA